MSSLLEQLHRLLGPESFPAQSCAGFTVDGMQPRVVVEPHSRETLVRLIQWAYNENVACIPWGAGTAMSTGNTPHKYEVAILLRGLNRLVEYTPEDMTVTVEAGMTLGELQRVLAEHRQFLPIEAPRHATIGGILASNRYGPSRLAWGMARDWLIGVRFVRGDGKLVHGGGKVVKNVAGYDLCKLLVGSYGTLGVIVEATFKVAPLPEAGYVCISSLPHLALINASPVRPQFVELLNAAACREAGVEPLHNDNLLIGISGTREEVDWQAGQLATKRVEFSPEVVIEVGAKEEVLLRVIGPVSEFHRLHKELSDDLGARLQLAAHANLGVFRCALPMSPMLEIIIQRLRQEFQVVIERAPAKLKASLDAWGDPGPSLALMKKVKQELDPHAILNPGRFVGGI